MDEKRSPFEKVNIENMSLEEKEKLSDPNYKVTGKMEGKTEQPKTFGSKSQTKDSEDKIYIIFIYNYNVNYCCNCYNFIFTSTCYI